MEVGQWVVDPKVFGMIVIAAAFLLVFAIACLAVARAQSGKTTATTRMPSAAMICAVGIAGAIAVVALFSKPGYFN